MKTTVAATRVILTVIGIALIVLGGLFWAGRSLSLLPLHMLLGGIFVLCMWLLTGLAFYTRTGRSLAVVVFVWGLIVPILGVEQLKIFPGELHWVAQAAHLVVGLVAIGLGHALAGRILRPSVDSSGLADRP